MFEIDTGTASTAPIPKSATIDGAINLASQGAWAERAHRQIIEAIEVCDDLEVLEEYWAGESLLLDSFYMDRPEYWERIKEAYDDQRIFLDPKTRLPSGNTDPAAPGNILGLTF